MNRSPTPGGVFATNFVGVRCAFHGMFVGILRNVHHVIANRQQHFGKPFAAVGADLSCPRI